MQLWNRQQALQRWAVNGFSPLHLRGKLIAPLIGQRPNHSEHARACVSQLCGAGVNVALVARTNR